MLSGDSVVYEMSVSSHYLDSVKIKLGKGRTKVRSHDFGITVLDQQEDKILKISPKKNENLLVFYFLFRFLEKVNNFKSFRFKV